MSVVLVTGSGGLVGSQAVEFFAEKGFETIGVDNNMRQYFFGKEASTRWRVETLKTTYKNNYHHYDSDIRDQDSIISIFKNYPIDLVIHTAAQPSHDWAAKEPLTDFSVNVTGSMVLLEALRKIRPEATFVFTSTNKVYGDTPNTLPLVEQNTRWEIQKEHYFFNGINETMSIDASKHSLFGASKVAADVLTQEYGKYFGLKTGVFRGGCLTGEYHSGAELHGFLAYLAKCIATGRKYSIFGYKGKQVRDNIHAYDLINAFYHFYEQPSPGEIYNIGGGRFANISMMEAISKFEILLDRKANIEYVEKNRSGDHIWYISDVGKFQCHYPQWEYTYDMDRILYEIVDKGRF